MSLVVTHIMLLLQPLPFLYYSCWTLDWLKHWIIFYLLFLLTIHVQYRKALACRPLPDCPSICCQLPQSPAVFTAFFTPNNLPVPTVPPWILCQNESFDASTIIPKDHKISWISNGFSHLSKRFDVKSFFGCADWNKKTINQILQMS